MYLFLYYYTHAVLLTNCAVISFDSPLVASARELNRASIESIHTIHFRYSVRKENIRGEVTVSSPSEYWRSGSTIRDKWQTAGRWTDTIISDGRIISKSNGVDPKTGKAIITGSISRFDGMPLSGTDPWQWSMFVFFGDVTKPPVLVCFDDLLKISHRIIRAEHVVEEGRKLDMVEVEFAVGSSTTFWFDPAVNYLINRMQVKTVDSSNSRIETIINEVKTFKDGGGGIYFPDSVIRRRTINGKIVSTETMQFTEIQINKPLAADDLKVNFPAGSEVHDLVAGKVMKADPTGSLSSSDRELLFPPPPSAPSFDPPLTETRVEPSPYSRWPLYLAGFCFFIALTVIFMRLRKARSNSDAQT